jgi:hypothetical protein
MIRFPCCAALVTLILAGPCLCAESNGPLESSKQELRTLEGGQRTKEAPSATEGLRPSIPSIQTPGQDTLLPMPRPDAGKLEKERKRRQKARENWLVNGVEQLEKSERKEPGIPREIEKEDELDSNDSAEGDDDPQYLLKLYDEQKKMDEGRESRNTPHRVPRADPLAPFLQGWLGSSPVRGQFFDEFVRRPSDTAAGQIPAMSQSNGLSEGPASSDVPSSAIGESELRPNPYLAPLNTPAGSPPDITPGVFPGSTGAPSALPSFDRLPLPSPMPPPVVRQPERKPPPAPSADDRKYFPQLKKF